MSVDNSELLMLLGGKKSKSTIGIAGQKGFGVGVYGGDPADLTAMGLAPMEGCENPSSDNYGNYIHTNGSVMVFIPAFCYRIGNTSAPSYSRDEECALEIRDASEGEGDGWVFHRAFIDGGVRKLGFFIDKYICSYAPNPINAMVSVKNGDNVMLNDAVMTLTDISGTAVDAITLGRHRGEQYSCVTCFQWSAISMLSLAHGQAATSNQFCGWYDANHKTNYPKGNNNNGSLGDTDDPSVKWTAHGKVSYLGKTGSGSPFNKTTHNGQNCGVTDVNGSQHQVVIGCQIPDKGIQLMKESVKAHAFTRWTRTDGSMYDHYYSDGYYFGYYLKWGYRSFHTGTSGFDWVMCGILANNNSSLRNDLFGNDLVHTTGTSDNTLLVGGAYNREKEAGVWARFTGKWTLSREDYTFRISGYAN